MIRYDNTIINIDVLIANSVRITSDDTSVAFHLIIGHIFEYGIVRTRVGEFMLIDEPTLTAMKEHLINL